MRGEAAVSDVSAGAPAAGWAHGDCGISKAAEHAAPAVRNGGRASAAPRATLGRALRAEALKFRHAAPLRLAVIMALPFPLLALAAALGNGGPVSFSPWNYWYALLMDVMIALVTGCVANADARLRNRALLGSGAPLGAAWWAKALYCLGLSLLANLIVFTLYAVAVVMTGGAGAAPPAALATMLAAALAVTATSAWMIPTGLFLTARLGLLAGIFVPLVVQLGCGFAWSLVPLPQLFPPTATMVIPTAFIPVLPSGEPLAADMTLGGALVANDVLIVAGIAVGAAAFAVLTAAGEAWFARSEEVR